MSERLDDVRVIIDVGAKDTEYPIEYPDAICHLFEPNPRHFDELQALYGDNENIILNNYGLGDKEELKEYDTTLESFGSSDALPYGAGGPVCPIKTLDWYLEENEIDRVDFLKIDTEGYDYKVLKGGTRAIAMTRYLQYEHWDDKGKFEDMLRGIFDMDYIGDRNVLCKKKQ